MGLKKKLFDTVTDACISLLRLNRGSLISCRLNEKLFPVCCIQSGNNEILFHCPNELTRWRALTLFSKEPETIEWIDGFSQSDVFFDVGANVGLYSVYAAKRGIQVVAFEPESQNYALINRNFHLNRVFDRASCICVAVSDSDGFDYLYLPGFRAGCALNTFGAARDWKQNRYVPEFRQAMLSRSLDSLLYESSLPFPTHLKIDVDGLEPRIISGARKCLLDGRLKSLLIEINEESREDMTAVDTIVASGLKLKHKKHAPMFDNSDYKNVFNYIFTRVGN